MSPADVLDRPTPRVDPRIAERRALVAADRRRRRLRWLVGATVVVAVGAACWGLTRTGLADVDGIDVVGSARTPADQIVAASGVLDGQPLLDVDPAVAAARVEALPWVATAQVERHWGEGRVSVTIQERRPAAVVVAGADRLVVDADGRVLEAGTADAPPPTGADLVVVEGLAGAPVAAPLPDPAALDALRWAGALTPGLRSRVGALVVAPDGYQLTLVPQGTVRLGTATDLDDKVRTLQTVFAETQLDCLLVVDVRVPDTAVLTRDDACE